MAKMTLSITTMALMMTMLMMYDEVFSLPTSEQGPLLPLEDGVKVSELRQKLQLLHKLLKDYNDNGVKLVEETVNKHNDGLEKSPNKSTASESSGNEKGDAYDVIKSGENSAKHTTAAEDASKNVPAHNRARAVKSEDMKRSLERDSDENDLNKLARSTKTKTKRQENESVQILAKALAQLNEKHLPKHTDVSVGALSPRENIQETAGRTSSDRDRDVSETEIMKALMKLLAKEDGDAAHSEETGVQIDAKRNGSGGERVFYGDKNSGLPLFHGGMNSGGAKNKAPSQASQNIDDYNNNNNNVNKNNNNNNNNNKEEEEKEEDQVNNDISDDDIIQKLVTSLKSQEKQSPQNNPIGINKNGNNNDIKDNDNGDEEDLLKALLDAAGYKSNLLTQGASRSQVLEETESRLMEDIQMANNLGISVGDLIKDMEEKALKEAILERIQRILEPR